MGSRCSAVLLLVFVAFAAAPPVHAVNWGEDFELHGEFSSRAFFRSPSLNFGQEFHMSSWHNELELDMLLRLRDEGDFRAEISAVLNPSYDAVYDVYDVWGERAGGGAFGSGASEFQKKGIRGKRFPGHGKCVRGEFCLGNQDNVFLFTGDSTRPGIAVNPVLVANSGIGPFAARGSRQPKVGGKSSGETFLFAASHETPGGEALQRSLILGATGGNAEKGLATALNAYAGGRGDRGSFDQLPAELNQRASTLKFNCFDNSNRECFLRELLLDLEKGNSFLRLGRQQIAWGKMDAFQLQDVINPIDLGMRNVFPDLERRRIPVWAARGIQTVGVVGPFEDVQAEAVWVVDQFRPKQIGQCGEPWAFALACEMRLNASTHSAINLSLAEVNDRPWTLASSEPGARLEFYLPKPALSFSLSAFWGFQDTPVLQARNSYSTDNPNPAAMLAIQATGAGDAIDFAAGNAGDPGPWVTGFDPYDHVDGKPNGTLAEANEDLISAWEQIVGSRVDGADDPLAAYQELEAELEDMFGFTQGSLATPWSGSELVFRYPRVLSLGGSVDYDWTTAGSVIRAETAYEVDRHFTNTAKRSLNSSSDVIKLGVGVDRPTVIPFVSGDRSSWITVQMFWEHILDYDDGGSRQDGMVAEENGLQSTIQVRTYWLDDSLELTNFAAVDWNRDAWAIGPKLAYSPTDAITFEVGLHIILGRRNDHTFRNVCSDGSADCIGNPRSWVPGQWQVLNRGLQKSSEAPFFPESFGDTYMQDRDEIWFGVRYSF